MIAATLPPLLTVAPLAAQPPSARDALRSFKALHSALDIGLNYQDYNRRLVDTKIRFDQYMERKPATIADAKIGAALMNYHRLAQSAWSGKIQLQDELLLFYFAKLKDDKCVHVKPLADAIARNYGEDLDRKILVGRPWSDELIPAYWSCASDKLAEAEKLLGK